MSEFIIFIVRSDFNSLMACTSVVVILLIDVDGLHFCCCYIFKGDNLHVNHTTFTCQSYYFYMSIMLLLGSCAARYFNGFTFPCAQAQVTTFSIDLCRNGKLLPF